MSPLVVLFAVIAAAVAAPSPVQKRSIGHAVAYAVPAAVSHQSRVDVHSSPAVVATVAEPVVYSAPVPSVYAAPQTVYVGGSAVSHQSRVDVRTSPEVVATEPVFVSPAVVAEPAVVEARAVYSAPSSTSYVGGSAVSHQSRVDVQSSPAVYAEQVVPSGFVDARSLWAPTVYASAW